VYNLAQKLPGYGVKVTVLAPYESSYTASLRHQGSEVLIAAIDDDPTWRTIQFTTEVIRHLGIDVVHAHLPKAHILGGIAGRLASVPVAATVHGMDINMLDLGASRAASTHLITVCHAAYVQAQSYGIPAGRLSIIPNGVDTKIYSANRSGASFRKALHLPADAPLVGFVGRLAWEKGPDQFVRVAEYVHKQRPDVHFAIVGDGPMAAEIQDMVETAHLSVVFHLPGVWTNTWEVYPAFDILAQTSRVEGMPFAILEGMACGCPVTAMGVGGVLEIVDTGNTGLLSAPDDAQGLGNAVLNLLENPEKMKQMGQAGRKRVEEYFDIQDGVRSMANLFKRLVDPKTVENQVQAAWPMIKKEHESVALNPVNMFPKRE
jgi:glycosyltransferase involved in cell wall biosynthesis